MNEKISKLQRGMPVTLNRDRPAPKDLVIDMPPHYDGLNDSDVDDRNESNDVENHRNDSRESSRRSASPGDSDSDDDGSGVNLRPETGRRRERIDETGDDSDHNTGGANRPSLGRTDTVKRHREPESSYSSSGGTSSKVSTEWSESLNEHMSAQSYRYNRGDDERLDAGPLSSKVKITDAAKKIPAKELAEFLDFADKVYEAYDNADKALKDALDHADALDKVRWEPRWIKGWNAITTGLRERCHPGKEKGPNLISPIVQSYVYYGWGLLSLVRLASYSALLAQKLVGEDSVLVREPACSITRMSAAVPTALVAVPATIHALVMFRDYLNGQARYWNAMAEAWSHVEGALDYVNSETSSKANSVHWESFMAACRKNPYLSADAKLEQVKATASVRRDCFVMPCNIALSISAQLGLILGAPAATSGGLLAGSGMAYLAQGYLDRQQGLAAEVPRAHTQIDAAKRRLRQLGRDQRDEPYLAAAKRTFRTRQRALRSKQTTELWGGWLRGAVKANANFIIGLASLGLGTYSLITSLASSPQSGASNATLPVNGTDADPAQCYNSASLGPTLLSSAGTLIGLAANAVGSVYYPLTAKKVAGRSANESKELQRAAQILIGWCDEEDLVSMIKNDEGLTLHYPKGKLDEARGWSSIIKKTVFPADNEYIGLHLIAHRIMGELDKPEFDDECPVFEWLRQEAKMRQTDMRSMIQIARSTARVRRLDVIKVRLAPWLGTEFRLSANKQERALKASAVVEIAKDLCVANDIDRSSVRTPALAQSAYRKMRDALHEKVTPEAFILAVEKVWKERIRASASPVLESVTVLNKLAKAARQARTSELAAISHMSKSDLEKIRGLIELDREGLTEFRTGVHEYADLDIQDFSGRAAALDRLGKKRMTSLLMANPLLVVRLDCAVALKNLLDQIDPRAPLAVENIATAAKALQSASGYETTTVDAAESGNDAQGTDDDRVLVAETATDGLKTARAKEIRRSLTSMRTQNIDRIQKRPVADAFQDRVEEVED